MDFNVNNLDAIHRLLAVLLLCSYSSAEYFKVGDF